MGKMGLLHASLINTLQDVELVALCDKSVLMNRLFKKVFSSESVRVVNDVAKLSGLDLDAVYVTTPISSHAPIIRQLVLEGITRNVFCEKTLASNYVQAKELRDLADKTGALTMVGYVKRFNVVFGKAKQLLSDGVLGKPRSFKAYAYSSDFLGLTKDSKSSAPRGGALRDIGCHIIDLALWLLGDMNTGDIMFRVGSESGSEIAISFTASNAKGLSGRFDISQQMPNYRMPEFGLSIECSEGKIDVNDDRLRMTAADGLQRMWYRHDLNDAVYFSIGDPEYFREDERFVESLKRNQKCEPNFQTASKVDFMIDQARDRCNP
jgi:predicted dehydrogenase